MEVDQKNIKSSKKSSHMPFFVPILIPLIGLIIWYFVSLIASGTNVTYRDDCSWCGKGFTGRGYTHLFGIVQQVKKGEERYALTCSSKCSNESLRSRN